MKSHRRVFLAVGSALALLAQSPLARATPTAPAAATRAQQILADLNQIRRQHRLPLLSPSPQLAAAATRHARVMGTSGYFEHTLDGLPFASWIARFYPQAHARNWLVGENILWATQPLSVEGALAAWMRSPEHRANILDPAYRQVGIAVIDLSNAPGVYQNTSVTIAVTDFGARTPA